MSETRDTAALDFVESDGEPLAETELHLDQVFQLRESLKQLARQRDERDVHVGSNLLFYFDEHDARRRVAPDVFFARGLDDPARLRRTYKLWEERKAPDLIIEVTSRGTWEEDLERKKALYRDVFRTSEYVIFDPEEDLVEGGPLLAWRLAGRAYRRAGTAREFESQAARATFRVVDRRLRVFDDQGRLVACDAHEGREDGLRLGREDGLRLGREDGLRLGREDGLRLGREAGLREAIAQVLQVRFGPVPGRIREHLAALVGPDLDRALTRAATTPSLEALLDRDA